MYVLIASLWEAYCEDIVTESLDQIVAHAGSYQSLPPVLIKEIAKNIQSGKGTAWDLAGEGWRDYIKARRDGFEQKRNKEFAGTKSASVEQFFYQVLGIEQLSASWKFAGYALICENLDAHLDRRNTLVHRFSPGRIISKKDVKDFFNIVSMLVEYTDEIVDEMLTATTGESRWTAYKIGSADANLSSEARG
jgi:hypothetical protein